jgi:hypothetical protein
VRCMSSEQYRQHAAICLRLAQLATDERDKIMLLHMADAWRRLAGRIESGSADRDERSSPDVGPDGAFESERDR